jgi:membrane protease YdiL (CAAX protease family)
LAAAIFAVGHFERGVVLNLFLLAVFMGYIYRKTGSMRYSLLFHMVINGMAVMALIMARLYPELVVAMM